MSRILRRTLTTLAIIMLVAASGSGATADWEADAFEIRSEPARRPTTATEAENLAGGTSSLNGTSGFEADLAGIAAQYEAQGFRSPMLDPVKSGPRGSKVYGVFLFDFPGSIMKAFSNNGLYEAVPRQTQEAGCKPITSGWLALNAAGSPTYVTAAHELFHAVQAAYPFRQGCRMADWIKEGMAKAVEQVMYLDHTGRELGDVYGNRGTQGLRPYNVPLHYEKALRDADGGMATFPYEVTGFMTITRTEIAYGTASFWRFLIDVGGGLDTLHPMMRVAIMGDSPERRILWLDNALGYAKDHFGDDRLYALYPEFVTEFASWGGTRYKKVAIKDSGPPADAVGNFGNNLAAARNQWLKLAFNGCAEVEVGPAETKKVTLDVERIAARCIRVRYVDVREETTPVVEAVHDDSAMLDGLHLGVAWESGPQREHNCWQEGETYQPGTPRCLLKPQQLESTDDRWAREWMEGPISPTGTGTLSDQGVTEKLYVLSNVQAKEPWNTPHIKDLTFRVGLGRTVMASNEDGGPPEGRALKADENMQELAQRAQGREVSRAEAMEAASEMMKQVMGGMTAEAVYGAQGGIGLPVAAVELGTFSFERPDGRTVTLQPMPDENGDKTELGETGPLLGAVLLESPGMAMETSMLCASNEGRAGSVVTSNEDQLVIDIAVDICRMDPQRPMACADGCPAVDRVDATITLPAGWRYFASSAPEPVVTPGIEDYMRRFVDMNAPAFVGPRDASDDPARPDAGDVGPGDDAAGVIRETEESQSEEDESEFECACTCAELEEMEKLAEEAAQTVPPRLEDLELVQACMSQCFRQYAACKR